MPSELEIVINGRQLTQAQTAAVRVACIDLCARATHDPGMRESLGSIADEYRDRLNEVMSTMRACGG